MRSHLVAPVSASRTVGIVPTRTHEGVERGESRKASASADPGRVAPSLTPSVRLGAEGADPRFRMSDPGCCIGCDPRRAHEDRGSTSC